MGDIGVINVDEGSLSALNPLIPERKGGGHSDMITCLDMMHCIEQIASASLDSTVKLI